VEAADKWEGAHARLETAVKNSGGTWDQWSGSVGSAESKAEKLGFTNTNVEESLARLVPVTNSQKQATTDLSLAEDIARGRHIDLEAATQLLVKVQTGHVSLLGRLGINTKDATGATISQQEAITRLSEYYGGNASRYADTFAGKMKVIGAEAEDTAKNIGMFLIPIIEDLGSALSDGVSFFVHNQAAAIALGVVIGGPLVAAMGVYIVQQGLVVGGKLVEFWGNAGNAVKSFATFLFGSTAATDANTTAQLVNTGVMDSGAVSVESIAGARSMMTAETLASTTAIEGETGAMLGMEGATVSLAAGFLLPVAAAVALGYGIHTLMGGFDDTYAAFHRGEDAGKSLAASWASAASKTANPIHILRDDLSALNVSHEQHLAAIRADGGGFNDASQEALRYHTAQVALKKAISDTTTEHQQELVATKQVAEQYGITIPGAVSMTSSELKAMQSAVKASEDEFGAWGTQAMLNAGLTASAVSAATKSAVQFGTDVSTSWSSFVNQIATHDFSQPVKEQTAVSEQDFEAFFVGNIAKANQWVGDLQQLVDAGVSPSIVSAFAKAGPGSDAQLQAMDQMVALHGAQWVNDMNASGDAQRAALQSSYNAETVDLAVAQAERQAYWKAADQAINGGNEQAMLDLTSNQDGHLAQMAQDFLTHMDTERQSAGTTAAQIQAYLDSLHGPPPVPVTLADYISSTIPYIQANINSLHGTSVDLIVNERFNASTGQIPGTEGQGVFYPGGAHGMVGLAHGGSAGMIVGPNQPVVIGEGLSKEAVVPYDNFGDMVATIRNTGRAADFMRASIAAGAVPKMFDQQSAKAGGDMPAAGGGSNVTQIVINVAGSVVTERQLVDIVQEGLLRNGRQGRGPGLS
jgi:hypothetical protein